MTTGLKRKHVLAATVGRSYSTRVIASGASNYWPLNETSGLVATDIVGGKNGTISGGAVLNGNNGIAFDGVNDFVGVPLPAPAIGTNSVTLECWVKTTVNQGFKYPVDFALDGDSGSPGVSFMTGGSGQVIHFNVCDGTVFIQPGTTTVPLDDGNWHHVVGVIRRGVAVEIYFDGVQRHSSANTMTASLTSTNPLAFGSYATGTGGWFAGSVRDVAIYPRALTPAEISAHFAAR